MTSHGIGGTELLRINGVSKRYGRGQHVVHAVREVSFTIGEGEALGLVGESGSGKSTLGRLASGLEHPTSGRVDFDGIDFAEADRRTLRRARREIQVVFQDPLASLNSRRTVTEIISAPLAVHKLGTRADRRARVREVLGLVGLNDQYGDRYPTQLSGGQCQRVAIARALAPEPRVLILDEAVSSVDVSIQGQLLNLLRTLQSALQLALLFISHDLAVVRYMTDHIAVMKDGRVVEFAHRADLFDRPKHDYTRALMEAIPEPPPRGPSRSVPGPEFDAGGTARSL